MRSTHRFGPSNDANSYRKRKRRRQAPILSPPRPLNTGPSVLSATAQPERMANGSAATGEPQWKGGRSAWRETEVDALCTRTTDGESATISTESSAGAETKHVPKASIRVRSAEATPTAPSAASDIRSISTPLRTDTWERKLADAGALEEFRDVVSGLREGFHLSRAFNTLSHTFTPPNHASARDAPNIICAHIEDEIAKGRYIGPFSLISLQSLIGHFRTSPLGVVPKPNSAEHRIIQDLSFPHDDPTNPSVNSEIDANDFPCKWGSSTRWQ